MAENNSKLRKKKAYTVKVNILTEVKKKMACYTVQFRKAASALRFHRPFPGAEWKKLSKGCSDNRHGHIIAANWR